MSTGTDPLTEIESRYGQLRNAPAAAVVSARVATQDTDALVDEVKRLRALLAGVEWAPGRWWRSTEPDGSLWGEGSDEDEIRRMALPRHTIRRQWYTLAATQWREA